MNIPDEVIGQEPLLVHGMRRQGEGGVTYRPKSGPKSCTSAGGFLREMEYYTNAVVAWARKEALREAAVVAESGQFWDDGGEVLSSDEVSYDTARREAASAIRAFGEGDN